ncbi:PQQ-dependent sugar dehydrogenase [Polymorphospora rubra]|uniref:PQQ-dependent sugar dehydrogenase n=1 Tax=Polymorphospora rubra TaxID=338584 RepID=UPI001BB440A9|nr:PQQ-dependent sugar dehydrogenase [Polymorphospora rubra]
MPGRRRLLAALTSSVLLAALLPAAAATAHPGPHDDPPPPDERFQKVLLENTGLTQPMRLSVTPDGRVVYIERDGRVKVWDPQTRNSVVAGSVPVRVTGELGMVGLALARDFAQTGHLFLHFSPPQWDTTWISRVSRFTLGADNTLDPASEKLVIDIPHPRGVGGGHSAGDLLATEDGYLFIATGDNTSCCASRGFPGTDERPGQANGDAQRTSANTNDLNGKILRIVPKADGGYDIPEGNLFPVGTDKTRPEIYAMGFRNPFTIGDWDPATGRLWMADYGPDAVLPDPERGPAGHVQVFLMDGPGNYGWPYCTMNKVPYNDWNYVEDKPGPWFDCDAPVNDSPNNTGLVNLPPIKGSTIYYTYDRQEYFPELFGGGAMAGPMYHYDADNPSTTKFPQWFDGRRFLYDWTTDWIQTTGFDAQGAPYQMHELLPDLDFRKPMDMEFGPDGSLYLLEYGNGWGASNDDAGIYRIDYVEGNRAPLVSTSLSADSGALPLTVRFDASASTDPDGNALTYAWDFDGDGTADATGAVATHTYTTAGEFQPRVTVRDSGGAESIANLSVVAGNTRPVVTIETPVDGGWAEFGENLPFRVRATDAEEGVIDCTKIKVAYQLGHNSHGHPMAEATPNADCTGVLVPGRDASHGPGAYVFHVLEASYTDGGGVAGAPALTGSGDIVLHPRQYAASTYQKGEGVGLYTGQLFVPGTGNWFMFPRINVAGITHLNVEFATRLPGVNLTVRAGSPTGPVVATFSNVPGTGSTSLSNRVYKWFGAPVRNPGGVHDLYFVADWTGQTQPELFVRGIQFQTTPTVTATVSPPEPTAGWYTGDVTLTYAGLTAGLWTGQHSVDGGTTWIDAAADGTATIGDVKGQVLYRAVDRAGNTSRQRSLWLRVDRTGPTVDVSGITDGASYGNSGTLTPDWTVTDTTSGVAGNTNLARLDDREIRRGRTIRLADLPPGEHTLVVTATDRAGNTTTRTVRFTTTTSVADLRALVDGYAAAGTISATRAGQLTGSLDRVATALAAGDRAGAVAALDTFLNQANTLNAPGPRAQLVRDAQVLIVEIR